MPLTAAYRPGRMAVAVAAFGAIALVVAAGGGHGPTAGRAGPVASDGEQALLADLAPNSASAATVLRREGGPGEVGLSVTTGEPGGAASGVGLPAPSEPWTSAPRSDEDLARLFLTGDYAARDFVRHVLLNPEDRPFDLGAYREFEDLVASTRSASRPFRDRMRSLALADREAVIRNAGDRPRNVEITAAELRSRAEALAKRLSTSNRQVSVEEAMRLIENGEAFSVRLPRNTSFIDGKVYRNGDFRALENFDRAFDLLQQLAVEEATVIVGWFVTHGFCSLGAELQACFARILEASPRDLDR